MHTIFDWWAMAMFAGLVVLFLQRSMAADEPRDRIWHYAPPALGCAIANYVGNLGLDARNPGLEILSGVMIVAIFAYILHILKPFPF